MHLYPFDPFFLVGAKTGATVCGVRASVSKLTTKLDRTTCPHCRAIYETADVASAALLADSEAGRLVNGRAPAETLRLCETANQARRTHWQGDPNRI